MPYTVYVRTNKSGKSYTYYTRREADSIGIEYAIPPITVERFDKRDIKHVLSENDYVLPVIQWRWQRKHLERSPLEYVTPYGTASWDGFIFCTCSPKGFLGKRTGATMDTARRYVLMARWMTMYGDANIAFRMTYGRGASTDEIDRIVIDEQFQVLLRNEMLSSGESLAIPLQEIIRMRLRLTSMMEDVVRKYHDEILVEGENAPDLKDFIKLFETQKTNLVDLEVGYTRDAQVKDSGREVELSWRMKSKGNGALPQARHPFVKVTPVEQLPEEIEPMEIPMPEGFEVIKEMNNEQA